MGRLVVIDYGEFVHSFEVENLNLAVHFWLRNGIKKLHLTFQPIASVVASDNAEAYLVFDKMRVKLGRVEDVMFSSDSCMLVINPDVQGCRKLLEWLL